MNSAEANKQFYDKVYNVYDEVDGRRDITKSGWLVKKLEKYAKYAGNDNLLDLGCGTGYILRLAKPIFKQTTGIDVSDKIMKSAKPHSDFLYVGDITRELPFNDNSFNVVSCFAVLHHLENHKKLFKEVHRVLKPKGIFYIDHDLDELFYKRFKLFIELYRKIKNPARKYSKAANVSEELYHDSEAHPNGLDLLKLINSTNETRFMGIKDCEYHWHGIFDFMHILFSDFNSGYAPIFSMAIVK